MNLTPAIAELAVTIGIGRGHPGEGMTEETVKIVAVTIARTGIGPVRQRDLVRTHGIAPILGTVEDHHAVEE